MKTVSIPYNAIKPCKRYCLQINHKVNAISSLRCPILFGVSDLRASFFEEKGQKLRHIAMRKHHEQHIFNSKFENNLHMLIRIYLFLDPHNILSFPFTLITIPTCIYVYSGQIDAYYLFDNNTTKKKPITMPKTAERKSTKKSSTLYKLYTIPALLSRRCFYFLFFCVRSLLSLYLFHIL